MNIEYLCRYFKAIIYLHIISCVYFSWNVSRNFPNSYIKIIDVNSKQYILPIKLIKLLLKNSYWNVDHSYQTESYRLNYNPCDRYHKTKVHFNDFAENMEA